MLEQLRFYFSHSINDLLVNKRRTFFALLSIAAGVAAIVSLQTLAVMIGDTLTGNLQENNQGDIQIEIIEIEVELLLIEVRDGQHALLVGLGIYRRKEVMIHVGKNDRIGDAAFRFNLLGELEALRGVRQDVFAAVQQQRGWCWRSQVVERRGIGSLLISGKAVGGATFLVGEERFLVVH